MDGDALRGGVSREDGGGWIGRKEGRKERKEGRKDEKKEG